MVSSSLKVLLFLLPLEFGGNLCFGCFVCKFLSEFVENEIIYIRTNNVLIFVVIYHIRTFSSVVRWHFLVAVDPSKFQVISNWALEIEYRCIDCSHSLVRGVNYFYCLRSFRRVWTTRSRVNLQLLINSTNQLLKNKIPKAIGSVYEPGKRKKGLSKE